MKSESRRHIHLIFFLRRPREVLHHLKAKPFNLSLFKTQKVTNFMHKMSF
ncbi:hypothetical protein HanRHA438_Chr16g0742151 [Helianthus annuus]|nr:hypothetical protein HanRHA438_Chr16g0742151 [Helianthus annuus]